MFKKPEIISENTRIVAGGEVTWGCGSGNC